MGIKDFFIRKMVESKMKDVPQEQQEKMLALIQKNPELFQKIALDIQTEMKNGKDEMGAAMVVMGRYKSDLEKIM
jgi:hypothetical protein